MSIERKVVGEQADVVLEQRCQSLPANTGDAPIFATPEVAVMHHDRIETAGHRAVEQQLACGHPAQHATHFAAAFHLKSVWAIIAEAGYVEKIIQVSLQRG